MIDLTPLDVRKKRGDFGRRFRGYDREEVDGYLELVAERLEELVRENLALRERVEGLAAQVAAFLERERAVQEAIITAQRLRDEIHGQAQREAELLRRETQAEIERVRTAADRLVEERRAELAELGRKRTRFLVQWRAFLERQVEELELEEARARVAEETALEDVLRKPLRGGAAAALPEEPAVGERGEEPAAPMAPAQGDAAPEREGTAEAVTAHAGEGEAVAEVASEPAGAGSSQAEASEAVEEEEGEPLWLSSIFDEEEPHR